MKASRPGIILLATALLSPAPAKPLQSPPVGGTTSPEEPCGNPLPSKTPDCPTCVDKDDNIYSLPVGSTCKTNSILAYNGNAHRKITDLEIAGSVGGMPLKFIRYSNTRLSSRNLAHSAFGVESSWSHNFEWVMRDAGGTAAKPRVTITYPQGDEMTFERWSATSTSWLPVRSTNPDRLIATGDDFVLHTGDLEQYRFKRRFHSVSGAVFYRIESMTDSAGNSYSVSYVDADDTLIRQVTDPAGHWIKLHYNDMSVRSNTSTLLAEQSIPANSADQWLEVNVTPGESFRVLALYQGNTWRQQAALKVTELEFFDENNQRITGGTAFGSWPWVGANAPARALDGNTSTFYQYQYEKAGFVGIDFGAGNSKQVSRIRYRLAGPINADATVSFVGMNNPLTPNYVVSHVEGSDGREVGYDYNTYTEPSGFFQWVQLSAAHYEDMTSSSYTYLWQHRHVMPVLRTANDPRYTESVQQVRYGYDLNTVVGFVVDEFDNATGQLLVSVRWDGAHIPKLVYPNGKIHRFEHSDGMLVRAVDSYGGATDYTYTWNGFVLSENDSLGRTTTYTRRSDGKLMSIQSPGGSVTTYTRDTAGYIMSVNRNGKLTSYVRDSKRRITRTNHPDGSFETWTYNSFGQPLTHRLRNGRTESWTYNAAGRKLTHTSSTNVLTGYSYDALGRLASETRYQTPTVPYSTVSYEYNDRGLLTKVTHPDGTSIQHEYDSYGNRIGTLDERGGLTIMTYDSLGRKLTETDPNGNTTSYDYTSSLGGGCGCNTGGLPVMITHPDGKITLNRYDKEWRLISTTEAHGTPLAAVTSFGYDVAGQRISMTDPLNRVTEYTHDNDGRIVAETRAKGTPQQVVTTMTYDLDGNRKTLTEASGTPIATTTSWDYDNMNRVIKTTRATGTADASITLVGYNNLGQRVSSTDPLNRLTQYVYDTLGRPRDTILPDGTIMRTEYDIFSRVTKSTAALGLPEEDFTTSTYDLRDRVVTQTDSTGVSRTTHYYGDGLVEKVVSSSGRTVEFLYDPRGNRTATITAPGTLEETIASTTYDSMNRPLVVTDGEGSTTTMKYDILGRVEWTRNHLNQTTHFTYDLVGNQLTVQAADGVVTATRVYDALNRLDSEKDGKNQITDYRYDLLGRMTSYVNPKLEEFEFQYDFLGRLTRRTEPDTTYQAYTYDAASRLITHRKADGQIKTHHYDDPDRDFLTRITYTNGETQRSFSYDALGRMTTASNAHATITRDYDSTGRLTSETQAFTGGPSGTFTYEYDTLTDDGNLSRHTRPDGSFIDYTYNSRNLLGTLSADGPPPVAEYTYNLRSQIQQTEIENGLFTVTRGYDGAGRLTGVANGIFDATGYTLSPDGRRTRINRNGQVETYDYDNARQVEEATYTGLSTVQSWQYDGAGNRTSATTNGSTTNYSANAVNEYLSISGMPGTPSYDDNGNALDWNVRPYGSSTVMAADFTWNINNELVGAVNSSGDSAAYAYDALGRRVARTLSVDGVSSTTWFFTNAWNVELEHNGTAFTRRLTWGLDLSGSLQGAGGVGGLIMVENLPGGSGTPVAHFPAYDGNGNITTWVNATGTITARLRYDAYGNILSCTDGSGTLISPLALPSDYGFSTKPADRVTGMLYYGYRYYDPVTGRWPSRDPIEESGGMNLYGFVGNNGVNDADVVGKNSLSKEVTNALLNAALEAYLFLAKCPDGWQEHSRPSLASYGIKGPYSYGDWTKLYEYSDTGAIVKTRSGVGFYWEEYMPPEGRQTSDCSGSLSLTKSRSFTREEGITLGAEFGLTQGIGVSVASTTATTEETAVGSSRDYQEDGYMWMGVPVVLKARTWEQTVYDEGSAVKSPLNYHSHNSSSRDYFVALDWLVCKRKCDEECSTEYEQESPSSYDPNGHK